MNETNEHQYLTPGTLLDGSYQIIEMIGKGGMGAVYMAYDVRLDRKVAVKIISPDFSDAMAAEERESILKRFESEARIAAKIDHPNVIRIFGFKRENIPVGTGVREIDYLAMELLAGRTLRNTMDVSGFEYEEEIREWISKYMIPILEGLQTVHERGIIHRDLKPENFLMKDDTPKLVDFGLSVGIDLPSVTASVAEIYGTVTYMAPEQFYNFSLAREPADIYAIGKILYEVVEGKMSEKIKPFKQARLPNADTPFLQALNEIVMNATEENPNQRISSAKDLKERLMALIYCRRADGEPAKAARRSFWNGKLLWPAIVLAALAAGAIVMHYTHSVDSRPAATAVPAATEIGPPIPGNEPPMAEVQHRPFPDGLKKTFRGRDNSIFHLIPPTVIEPREDMEDMKRLFGPGETTVDAVYLAENPVTNQQYLSFLNENLDRIEVIDNEVFFDGDLILKLSEKIRGYKPIVFDGERFFLKEPMHAACAVLMVTGHGADAYATYYGMRLPDAREWFYVMATNEEAVPERIEVPTPVINYSKDSYGLRGVNQIAEWGRIDGKVSAIFGQMPANMIGSEWVIEKDPSKYYTDTSFRLAKDVE